MLPLRNAIVRSTLNRRLWFPHLRYASNLPDGAVEINMDLSSVPEAHDNPFDVPYMSQGEMKELGIPWYARDSIGYKRKRYDPRSLTEEDYKEIQVALSSDPSGFFGLRLPAIPDSIDPKIVEQVMKEREEKWLITEERRRRNIQLRDRMHVKTHCYYRHESGHEKSSFKTLLLAGNNDGWVTYGIGKAMDADQSVERAQTDLSRNLTYVPRSPWRGLPHDVRGKKNSTLVEIRTRPMGTGKTCNWLMYRILEMAGVEDASAKIVGPRRSIFITILAIFDALRQLRDPYEVAKGRGKIVWKELDPGYIQDIYPKKCDIDTKSKQVQEIIDGVYHNSELLRREIPKEEPEFIINRPAQARATMTFEKYWAELSHIPYLFDPQKFTDELFDKNSLMHLDQRLKEEDSKESEAEDEELRKLIFEDTEDPGDDLSSPTPVRKGEREAPDN